MWMNEAEIDNAVDRWVDHPALGPATRTLANLRDAVNRMSDGWCYWQPPGNAAAKLQALIQGDPRERYLERGRGREDVTIEQVLATYRPIKTFRTRQQNLGRNLDFEIVERLEHCVDCGNYLSAPGYRPGVDGRCTPCDLGRTLAAEEARISGLTETIGWQVAVDTKRGTDFFDAKGEAAADANVAMWEGAGDHILGVRKYRIDRTLVVAVAA